MDQRSVGRLISILNRHAQMYLNSALKDLDIGSSEHVFLINLFKEDGITQEELSARIFIDKAATARALKSLEDKEYLRRESALEDKRAKKIYLTDKAIQRKEEIYKVLRGWTEILTEGLEDEDVRVTMDTLDKMAKKAIKACDKKKTKE